MKKYSKIICLFLIFFVIVLYNCPSFSSPPKLTIIHFDVNVGDATLIISPDKRAILIDCGKKYRGLNPIKEFLDRAKNDGHIVSLDYAIATHYDYDHIGGFPELFDSGWYPEMILYDRGDTLLPPFDRDYIKNSFPEIALAEAENIVNWGTAPAKFCNKRATGALVKYLIAAKSGGKRRAIKPGDRIELDHEIVLTAIVVNATDIDGNTVDVFFDGRNKDCASNDLSVGLLLEYGAFRYLIAGDLTGVSSEKVADVEELIKDDASDIDVYHINHHGSETCSSIDFLNSIKPNVVVVSNGTSYSHPRRAVIVDRIFTLSPKPVVYLTNKAKVDDKAWQAPDSQIADLDNDEFDGIIEIAVWKKSYRVFRWRNGERIKPGDRYYIKN